MPNVLVHSVIPERRAVAYREGGGRGSHEELSIQGEVTLVLYHRSRDSREWAKEKGLAQSETHRVGDSNKEEEQL